MIASDIQPIQNLRVLTYVGAEKKMEWGKYWITLGLQNVEKYLAGTAGRFCVGGGCILIIYFILVLSFL